eukprot:3633769-Pyramimonas_sp.AAC.1
MRWPVGESRPRRLYSSPSACLCAAKGRLKTIGLPTHGALHGTEGSHIAHRVSAMETTLHREVEAVPSCPRSILSRKQALRSVTG